MTVSEQRDSHYCLLIIYQLSSVNILSITVRILVRYEFRNLKRGLHVRQKATGMFLPEVLPYGNVKTAVVTFRIVFIYFSHTAL